jgi:hypothetical protein
MQESQRKRELDMPTAGLKRFQYAMAQDAYDEHYTFAAWRLSTNIYRAERFAPAGAASFEEYARGLEQVHGIKARRHSHGAAPNENRGKAAARPQMTATRPIIESF